MGTRYLGDALELSHDIKLEDQGRIKLGDAGNDLEISHSGSNSFIENNTGNLNIIQHANDGDIVFQSDDGAGSDATYFFLDGSAAAHNGSFTTSIYTQWGDRSHIAIGGAKDMQLYHDGSNSYIQQIDGATGDLIIEQGVDDKDIILKSDDGSGGTTAYITLDGSAEAVVFGKDPEIPQYINHTGDGNTAFGFAGDDVFRVITGGTTRLDIGSGIEMTGNTTLDGNFTVGSDGAGHDVKFFLNASGRYIMVDEDDNSLIFTDNASAKWGNGGDLQLMHDGTDSRIDNMVGHLKIRNYSDDSDIIFESDNGSGSTTEYLRIDGGVTKTIFSQDTRHTDGIKAYFGNGDDLELSHDGTDSWITNNTGDLKIYNNANDKDIIFASDDGSGGVETYFYLDGSTGRTRFNDSKYLVFGTDQNLFIVHDGTNSAIQNYTSGDFHIDQRVADKDMLFRADDGSGGTTTYFYLDGSTTDVRFDKSIRVTDSQKVKLGTGEDLSLFHSSSNSTIQNITGNLTIENLADDSDIILKSDDGSGGATAYITLDGSNVRTIFDESASFVDGKYLYFGTGLDAHIKHSGSDLVMVNTAGDVTIQNSTDDGDIKFICDDGSGGTTEYFRLDGGLSATYITRRFIFSDSTQLQFGNQSDTQIYNDGSNFYIDNITGDQDIIFKGTDDSSDITALTLDMSDAGTAIFNHDIKLADNGKAFFGGGTDLSIYHDGSNSYILQQTTGDLIIQNSVDDKDIILKSDDGSGGVQTYFYLDGSITTSSFINADVIFYGATSGRYMLWDESDDRLEFTDNAKIGIGSANDLQLYHDGSDSYIRAYNNDLIIMQDTADKDIVFKADDGSGGQETYFYLDGSANTDGNPRTKFPDNSRLMFGAGDDMDIFHNGTNSFIRNNTTSGDLIIQQSGADKDIIFKCDDGSGGETAYITLDGSATTVNVAKKLIVDTGSDNLVAEFKSSGDSIGEIRIADNSKYTRLLSVGTQFKIMPNDGDETVVFDGTTTTFNGTVTVGVDDTGYDVKFYGATTSRFLHWDESEDYLLFRDNVKGVFGNGADLKLYHDSNNSYIENGTGNLNIMARADDADLVFMCDDGSGGDAAYLTLDGSAGYTTVQKNIRFEDSVRAEFGNSGDLDIYHTGSYSVIDNATGHLYIENGADDSDIYLRSDDGSGGKTAYITLDGSAVNTIVHTDFLIPAQKKLRDSSNSNKYIELSDSSANVVYSAYAKHVWRTYNGSAYGDRMSITNTGELEAPRRKFAKTGTSDGDHDGDVVYFGGTTSMVAGKLYHYKSDGTWELADASAVATCDGLLGVSLGTASDTDGVLLRGMVTIANDPGAVGDVLFVSESAGQCIATAPSTSNAIVRVVGYCLDASNGQIWFNPDGTFVEVA